MAVDSIAVRYAQALFESAKAEAIHAQALEALQVLAEWLREQPTLRQFLWNPHVEPDEKIGLLDHLTHGAWPPIVRAFVRMVIAMNRVTDLPGIAEALAAMVDADAGRLRVVVRSAHPLPAESLNRLQKHLAHREGKQIELRTELDAELIGGLQVQLDHRVIDGSVRRQVRELRQRLEQVRVH